MRLPAFALSVVLLPSAAISQQGFSCSFGDRGACLGFGETVCSSYGMCVDQNSACFDRFQCDYQGFTCRSNVTECIEDNERLLDDYNTLIRDYNTLLDEHERTLITLRGLRNNLQEVDNCLLFASTLEAARLCSP